MQVISRKPPITEIIQMEYNLQQLKMGIDISTSTCDLSSSVYEHQSPINTSLPPNINNFLSIDLPSYSDLKIYTDGSGINDSIGCAFVAYCNEMEIYNQKGKLHKLCTVFQAELLAIYMATLWTEQNFTRKYIHILSDSFSAIQVIYSQQLHPVATNIRNIISNSHNSYTISWTRGHKGTVGNERADQLAKEAATDDSLDIMYDKICRRSIKKLLYEDLLSRWQHNWDCKHNDTTYKFIPNIKKYHNNYKWVIPSFSLTQFLTGHGKFSKYLHRFVNKQNDQCAICGQPDSVEHYIFTCIALETERLEIKTIAHRYNLNWPCKQEDLIKNKEIFSSFLLLIKRHEAIAIYATRE
ncbi:uncharacterized protein LOC111629033 [Centruroides sculpturatus]|uniref:uncharacterized protein LOC111629033 n=1 Tax=Centruroides sculpturatus TaxID=218467 RepID=UPI000C6E01C9|nr:uncharacterized protein LOC111629033 [Centruroides sculpturatus]